MTDGMAVSFVDEQDCGFFGESTYLHSQHLSLTSCV
jgi:hypothetical protein